MFVVAAVGAKVAKHGNRSVSSKSGSADVLEALGAQIELAPEQVARCIDAVGIGFMYAPLHHPAMKVVAPVRKEMGVRTLFNILGPLTNPADARNILMGVFHRIWSGSRCGCYSNSARSGRGGVGSRRHGRTLARRSDPGRELRDGGSVNTRCPRKISASPWRRAATCAWPMSRIEDHAATALDDAPACLARSLLERRRGLYAAGVADSITDGIVQARAAIASGAARAKLDDFVTATGKLAGA